MGVVLIPNQLVKLYKTTDFNQRNKKFHQDYRTYCQITKEEQTTMFQLRMTPEGSQILTNAEFTSSLSGWITVSPTWQWSTGQAQGIYGSAAATLIQSQILTANTNYALTIDVDRLIGADAFINLTAESGELNALKITRSEYGTNPGLFTLYFYSAAYVYHVIGLTLSGNAGDLAYINSVTLYKLTEPTVTLEDCEGNTIKTIDVFARGNDRLTYAVDWFGIDDGCYRICITDTEDLNKNYLDDALALSTEGDEPIELEEGGNLKWFG